MKSLFLKPNGEMEVKDLKYPLYDSMREEIGGYLEIVRPIAGIPHGFGLVIDLERKQKHLPTNFIASVICGEEIKGNVIFIREGRSKDFNLDFLQASEGQIEQLKSFINIVKGAR